MKTLIGYVSSKGAVREMANRLAERLDGEVDLVDLKKNGRPNPAEYDRVVLGGSIHAGRMQGRLKRYCQKHEHVLRDRKLGLFLCCLDADNVESYLKDGFGPELYGAARATGWFGGRIIMAEQSPLVRAILRRMTNQTADQINMRYEEVDRFAETMSAA